MKSNNFELFSTGVSYLIKSIQQLKSRKMAEYGLKGTTALCLCQILESETGLTAGELSDQGEIDKAQVSRCMAELGEKGFVFRNEKEGKQYRQKYCLTEKGMLAVADISHTSLGIREQICAGVEERDMEAFWRVLGQLCDNARLISGRKA
jgi:DNA-binding MarR family transcriptional regulator